MPLVSCKFCDKQHTVDPRNTGYDDYYAGLAHKDETGELLLYEGYRWLRATDTLPDPENYFIFANKPGMNRLLKEGDLEWFHAHGWTGNWYPAHYNWYRSKDEPRDTRPRYLGEGEYALLKTNHPDFVP